MKLLLLGCHLLLITASGEGQLDGWTTPAETDTPAGDEGVQAVEGVEGVSSTPSSDQPASQSTTLTATADEFTTSSPPTPPETTTSPPDVGEEPTVSLEAESDDVAHEDISATHVDTTSTSPAPTTTTAALAPVSEGSTSPTHSVTSTLPNWSTRVVADTSQAGEETSTSTLAISSSTEGVDSQDPLTTTTTTTTSVPTPAASTTTSTEHTTTLLTTTAIADTPTTQTITTTTTTEAEDGATTTTTLAADITTTTTTTGDVTTSTTSEESTRALVPESNVTLEPTAEPEPPLGVCFGKTEINTLVVVAVVVAVNVVAVVLTALCVHRIVSRRLSWDLLPLYRQRSTRGGDEVRRRNPSGRDLASDTECKAGEGGGQAGTHIPILITNEDGWCVPYSNEGQEGKKRQKKEAAATVDTGV